MKPSAYRDRVVDVAEEMFRMTMLLRGHADELVDRYGAVFMYLAVLVHVREGVCVRAVLPEMPCGNGCRRRTNEHAISLDDLVGLTAKQL